MDLSELFTAALKAEASDLHLSAGLPPMIRVSGYLSPLYEDKNFVLEHQDILYLLHSMMSKKERASYETQLEVDFSFKINNVARFRVNAFNQARGASVVFRIIPQHIASIKELGLPDNFAEITQYDSGLVLITGATGCGKSTTLAAMIDEINKNTLKHIITIEDPIEFVHVSQKSIINQREVHKDTLSFSGALRSALRADPDIILVGELRDLESMRLAITAAETGHLVLASLHTNSAAQAVHRIIDVFPGDEKGLIRAMLAESLRAVVSQKLIMGVGGCRIAACEIMVCTPAIRHLIREGKIAMIYSAIQTGQAMGMQTMEQHLNRLLQEGKISEDVAIKEGWSLARGVS